MNWRLVLLIIFILEGIYYLTNIFLFKRTFKEIKFWEWINAEHSRSFALVTALASEPDMDT